MKSVFDQVYLIEIKIPGEYETTGNEMKLIFWSKIYKTLIVCTFLMSSGLIVLVLSINVNLVHTSGCNAMQWYQESRHTHK